MPRLELLFDDATGAVVAHVSGAANHAEEHALVDELVAALEQQGYKVTTGHYQEKPKLPQIEAAPVMITKERT